MKLENLLKVINNKMGSSFTYVCQKLNTCLKEIQSESTIYQEISTLNIMKI